MRLGDLQYSDLLVLLKESGIPQRMIVDDHSEKCWVIRHDIDNHIENAYRMAVLENAFGVCSTYYFLNYDSGIDEDENYFYKPLSAKLYQEMADLGHDIGWHNNAITEWIKDDKACMEDIIRKPLEHLRSLGLDVKSSASHGDRWCRKYGYVNYEVWEEFECKNHLGMERYKMGDFGLDMEAYLMKRSHYLSDSGGRWNVEDAMGYVRDWIEKGEGNLQILIHSQWWG